MSEKTIPPSAPAKFSRYRSVRQQAQVSKPPPQIEKRQDAPIPRSMSRYRRSKSATPMNDQPTTPQSQPPIPSIPKTIAAANPVRLATDPVSSTPRVAKDDERERQSSGPRRTETGQLHQKTRDLDEQRGYEKETALRGRRREQPRGDAEVEQARQAVEQLTEHKRKDLERLEAELDAAGPARATSPKDKFAFFTRKRSGTRITPPSTATGSHRSTSEEQRRTVEDRIDQGGSAAPTLERLKSRDVQPRGIEQGGGGVVPGTDAPMSAVNAGERRVLIRCKQSSINLPITPETTPVDLIFSAANIINQGIIPSTAFLLESYTQLGLERRIRRYEHIRDIMNSWDRDTQNALILQNSDSPSHDTDLAASSVSREAPQAVSIYMYHSQKPGKWAKRYVTLLSSGQVYVSKKPGATISEKDSANICHLSDFDIYTATPQQLRKHIKPPKKYCTAIKSQQKTTMFLSTENFVHFFSSDDESLSQQWYDAVQQWRSWYLVNKRGGGEKSTGKTVTELKARIPARSGTNRGPTHKVKVSVDEDPYTIGSFKPLLDMDRFEAAPEPNDDKPRQIPFHQRVGAPLPGRRERDRPPTSYRTPPEAEEEFASSGLLGRTYTQRQNQQKDLEAPAPAQSFLEGPSLSKSTTPLSGTHHRSRSSSTKPSDLSTGLQRNTSKREQPKPLLDFTPQFKEAPQWDMTGKGRGVAPPTGVPLVEVATTPDNSAADLQPKMTLLRREVTSARPRSAVARGGEGAFVKGGLVEGI